MALTTYTLAGTATDLLGGAGIDGGLKRIRGYVEASQEVINDADANTQRYGRKAFMVAEDGAWAVADLPATGGAVQAYRVVIEYRDDTIAGVRTIVSNWFELVGNTAFADVAEFAITPVSTQTIVDTVNDARDETVAANAQAQTARNEAVAAAANAVDLSGISTPDGVIANRINDPASATRTALSATFATNVRTFTKHRLIETDEPGAFIAWTADDGYSSFADYFALLDTKGIKGTLFLTRTWVDRAGTNPTWNDGYITQAQVAAIATAGHEIGTHGDLHESQTEYRAQNGDAAYAALVQQMVSYIEDTYGVEVKTGAYPAGLSDRRVREIIGRTHEFYRGTKGVVSHRGQNPYDVTSVDVQALSEAQIRAYVDQAVAERSMVTFLIHGLSPAEKSAVLTKIGNVIDYAAGLSVRQGTFYEGMLERTAYRGSAGYAVDTSGNAFLRAVKTSRLDVAREDEVADAAWFDIDERTNAPYFDADGGQDFEFRKPLRVVGGSFAVGRRTLYGDVSTTAGSAAITSGSAGFTKDDDGVTITGSGIPAGATLAVVSATTATLSSPATATAANVSVVLGRIKQTAEFSGQVDFFDTLRAHHNSGLTFCVADSGESRGSISPTTWERAGDGGAMMIDTGTGGSNMTVKAFRFRFIDHTGARRIALAAAQPSDSSLDPGEVALYWDDATGELRFRGKRGDGTVVQRTVTAS